MTEILGRGLAFTAGVILGGIFFGGLWWTVRKGVLSGRPASWFLASLLLRMSISLTGFYLVSHGQWERLLLCLFGFMVARPITGQWVRTMDKPALPTQGGGYAPQSR